MQFDVMGVGLTHPLSTSDGDGDSSGNQGGGTDALSAIKNHPKFEEVLVRIHLVLY